MAQRALLSETWLPDWVRGELLSLLPVEPIAEYWSPGLIGDMEGVQIDFLAVLPGQLVGIRLLTVREPMGLRTHAEYAADVHSIPTSAIKTLATHYELFRFPEGQRESRRDIAVEIKLKGDQGLGPWGSPITLPLARDDYEGNREEAWRAALLFGKVLIAELQ